MTESVTPSRNRASDAILGFGAIRLCATTMTMAVISSNSGVFANRYQPGLALSVNLTLSDQGSESGEMHNQYCQCYQRQHDNENRQERRLECSYCQCHVVFPLQSGGGSLTSTVSFIFLRLQV